jgi:hypothetical protein
MHSIMGFMASIWQMPWYWRIWVALLMLVNGFVPFLFFESIESMVVLMVFALAAMTQMLIYHSKGFVRLLGAGHLYWIPMLGWLLFRLNEGLVSETMLGWIVSVLLLNTVSLLIDLADVIRYWRGERSPTIVSQR